MTPLVWGDRTWVRTCRSSGAGPSNAVLNTLSGDSTLHAVDPELVAVAVWTWVFSDRTAGESVQVVYPAAAMQLSYLGRLQSGVGQSDHRAVVSWLELDCDDRGSGRDRNCVSFPAPGEDDSPWRHDLEEVSRCGSRVRHDHAQCAAGDASTFPPTPCHAVQRSMSVKNANTVGGEAAIQRVTTTSLTGALLPQPASLAGQVDRPRMTQEKLRAGQGPLDRRGRGAACPLV